MRILTFPHCGRVFVCNDSLGILDARQAHSAFQFALQYGQQQANAYTRPWNMRAFDSRGTNDLEVLFDDPFLGFTSGSQFAKQSTPYYNRIPLEIADSFDMAAITVGFRMMDLVEEASINNGGTGNAIRCQKIAFTFGNLANSVFASVLDIYYDRAYYQSVVGTPSTAPYIDLATMTATGGFSAIGLTQDGHNVITILYQIPATMRQMNRAAAGHLLVSYELPKPPTGAAWTGSNTDVIYLQYKDHPIADVQMAFTGVNELNVRLYRSSTWTQGTASATATLSRAYALTPLTPFPEMGAVYNAGLQNSLTAFAESIKQIGWVASAIVGHNRGGINRPLVGNSFQFTEQGETLTYWAEIPQGATKYMILAYVRTDNRAGINQTLRFRIDANGFDTLATTTTLSSGSTAARYFYATGNLSAFSQPANGQINRCPIEISSEKTAYTSRNEAITYWDGVYSFLIKFF